MAAFIVWGLLLTFACSAVFTEKYRNRVLRWLQKRLGKFAPCAYALNLLFSALLFFSSMTFVFARNEVQRLDNPATVAGKTKQAAKEITADDVAVFYGWHFLQALPLLKVNETLRFKEPLTYDGPAVGLLLLTFQLVVILPVIRVFVWYWRHDEPSLKSAVVVYQENALKKGNY